MPRKKIWIGKPSRPDGRLMVWDPQTWQWIPSEEKCRVGDYVSEQWDVAPGEALPYPCFPTWRVVRRHGRVRLRPARHTWTVHPGGRREPGYPQG